MARKKRGGLVIDECVGNGLPKKNGAKIEITPDFKLMFASKNNEQKNLFKTISENSIVFVRGPAGTGKTHVSIAYALQSLFQKRYEKIILVRPIVEAAGERLGWLPGELMDKVKNYFSPIMAILLQMVNAPDLRMLMGNNDHNSLIQIVPLAYMRGITVVNSVLIFDESQNATIEQMRLLLTRIGDNSKFIVSGDTEQSDIAPHRNGLENAFEILQDIDGIGFVTMTEESIVRHPLIIKIEQRYRHEFKNGKGSV